MLNSHQVHLYTDGAAKGNPGPGGYGIVLEWVGQPYRKEFSAGFRHTTNNRMEICAVIFALKALKQRSSVELWTDSQYVQ